MATVPTLPDAERRTRYTLSAETGPKNVGFDIYGNGTDYADWVEVWDDGVLLTAVTDWTLDSPSGSLASIERPITDARITFTTARSGTIDIVGADKPQRTAQLSESSPFTPRDFNQLFTHLVARLREVWDRFGRTLRGLPGETINPIPSATDRASKYLAFDSSGQPIVSASAVGGATVSAFMATVLDDATAAAARATLGTVTPPGSSVNGNLASYSGTGGATLQDSGIAAANVLTTATIGVTVQAYDADTLKRDVTANLTAGYNATAYAEGTKSSGTFTPNPALGNFQTATNGGAHTLAPPASTCTVVVQYTNNGSAGSITTSGFTKRTGDSFTTANGDDFLCYITVVGSFSHLHVIALQ